MIKALAGDDINRESLRMFVNAASRDDEIGRAIRDGIKQGLRMRMEDLRKRLGIPHVPEDIT